ncbi:MAG: ferredoxin--NADP+ reductase [Chloroflexi bacterium]|jgi:ferredoxin--NADP+ reductase|nr:MAG: ferredoxin--NADP+ reductase [Chloroflexota bacterium]
MENLSEGQVQGVSVVTAELPKARIIDRRQYARDLFVFHLEPQAPFSFKAGQYVTLGINGIERPYSIASAPFEPLLEIFIRRVDPEKGGVLTPLLWELGKGDEVTMRPRAKGIFTFEPDVQNHVMVATTTGIAPFISILRQHFQEGPHGHRFFLFDGSSFQDEFVYDGELIELTRRYVEWVEFLPVVSMPESEINLGWKGHTGMVHGLIKEHLAVWGLDRAHTLVYACGHPGMIAGVKEDLQPEGWRVKEERFWRDP